MDWRATLLRSRALQKPVVFLQVRSTISLPGRKVSSLRPAIMDRGYSFWFLVLSELIPH